MNTKKYDWSATKLSTSVPGHLKPLIRQRAKSLDLTVSQYIRRLVTEETQGAPLNVVNTE
jgi:hypothetical protein